jgi:hypothetical protein
MEVWLHLISHTTDMPVYICDVEHLQLLLRPERGWGHHATFRVMRRERHNSDRDGGLVSITIKIIIPTLRFLLWIG